MLVIAYLLLCSFHIVNKFINEDNITELTTNFGKASFFRLNQLG